MLTGEGIEVIMYSDFLVDRYKVSGVSGDRLVMQNDHLYGVDNHKNYGRYFYENSFDFISQEGDWFFDTGIDRLYYLPISGKDPNTSDVEIPVVTTLISGVGEAASLPALTGDFTVSQSRSSEDKFSFANANSKPS